ncbi:TPA: hypothetical protein ACH3X2_012055 [Trebouxia sp. C0005]
MSAKRVARHNTLVFETLQSRLGSAPQSEFSECRLFDTDGSKYLLQREQDAPNVFRVSFSLAGFTENAAVSTNLASIVHELQTRNESVCRVSTGQGTYQVKFEILCDRLLALKPAQQLSLFQSVASVRADVLCWPLRQQLIVLKAAAAPQHETVVIYGKPGQPILGKQNQDDCLVVFPIWLSDGTSRAYTNAFIQGFAESRRLNASGDAPQCSFTAGPAPVPVPKAVQDYVNEAKGGFVSIVVLPRHVKESTLDEFVWTLLSFHDHVQYHVKCFKALIHGRMRKRMQNMILELGQAKTNKREVLAAINTN